jgi:hypothetical protein
MHSIDVRQLASVAENGGEAGKMSWERLMSKKYRCAK